MGNYPFGEIHWYKTKWEEGYDYSYMFTYCGDV